MKETDTVEIEGNLGKLGKEVWSMKKMKLVRELPLKQDIDDKFNANIKWILTKHNIPARLTNT